MASLPVQNRLTDTGPIDFTPDPLVQVWATRVFIVAGPLLCAADVALLWQALPLVFTF